MIVMAKQDKEPTLPEPQPPYYIGTWNGLTQWRCAQCQFDTLDGEDEIIQHIIQAHTVRATPPASGLNIVMTDRFGNPI